MDLTKPGNYPRSGRELVDGIAFLGRTIDKTRAHLAGTIGEYIAERGLSNRVYELFGVTFPQFAEGVRQSVDDAGVVAWLKQHAPKQPEPDDIVQHNEGVLKAGPPNEGAVTRFKVNLERLGLTHRTDITTYVDAEDLEEGREVSPRA